MSARRGTLFRRIYVYGVLQLLAVGLAVGIYNATWSPASVRATDVALYSEEGKLLGSNTGNPPAAEPQDDPPPRLFRPAPRFFTIPLIGSDGTTSYARIRIVPLRDRSPLRAMGALAIILLAVALVSYPAARAITRPLERLTRKARAVSEGDLRVRPEPAAPGEVGELASAFDEMVGRVDQALRRERELLANISHELRTPMARIRVALELAAEADPAKAREHLEGVAGDLSELERLVDDVLMAARLDRAGNPAPIPLRKRTIPAGEVIDDAVAHFRRAHGGRELQVNVEGALPELEADPEMLRRAIDNVLDNAAKYSDAAVSLHAAVVDGVLRVRAEDRGAGIDPADQARLFTPFFRADHSRSRATGGVGLGLALSRRILEAHGGTISLESKVGQGTVVTLTVPKR